MRLHTLPLDIKILTKQSKDVSLEINRLRDAMALGSMLKTFVAKYNALGMAAIQLGIDKNVFVMRYPWYSETLITIINPKIIWSSSTKSCETEQCLSVPDYQSIIERSDIILAEYLDETNRFCKKTIGLSGMDARIFQHEFDHLQGKLIRG